jgi:hypothetical protein
VSISVQIIVGTLIALGYLVTPTALIWGWTSWTRQPKQRTLPSILSLIGFERAVDYRQFNLAWRCCLARLDTSTAKIYLRSNTRIASAGHAVQISPKTRAKLPPITFSVVRAG